MTKNQQQRSEESFRPPLLTACIVVGLIWLTITLLKMGRSGLPMANWGAAISAGLTIRHVIHFFDDVAKLRAYRKRIREFKAAAKDHGQSSFGSVSDARAAGFTGKGRR